MTDYTAYVSDLLARYPEMVREAAALRFELEHPQRVSQKEMLEAMAFSKGDGLRPTQGHVSDKTFYIALNYQEQTAHQNKEVVVTLAELLAHVERKIRQLEHYVAQLPPDIGDTIRGLYFSAKSLKELAVEMHLSERTLRRLRNKGIAALADMYAALGKAGIPLE